MDKNFQQNLSSDPPPYSSVVGSHCPDPTGSNYHGPVTNNDKQPIGFNVPNDYPMTEQPKFSDLNPTNASAPIIGMKPTPYPYQCPSCNQHVITKVVLKPAKRTHVAAALLCLFGCWLCVCCPYFIYGCNNSLHYCTNCNGYIGSYL